MKEDRLFEVRHQERPTMYRCGRLTGCGPSRRRPANGATGGRRSPETARSPTWARRRNRAETEGCGVSNATAEKARTVLQEHDSENAGRDRGGRRPDAEAGVRIYVMGMLAMARKLDLLTVEEYMDLLAQIG